MKPKMSFRDWCIQNHAYLLLHFYQEGNNPCAPEEIGFSAGKLFAPFKSKRLLALCKKPSVEGHNL